MIGRTFSHYRILERIAEGGMGEVFLAEDTRLQRKVALKFLPRELTRDESRKQRFIQEARAAASMEHPYIAAVYDIDEVDGRTFIAMEYVRGQSLREALEGGPLGFRRALNLGIQIAEGLSKAHERGVIHRDLKPENVLLSEDGFPKIIDFGLAKLGEAVPSPPPSGSSDAEASISHEAETLLKTKEGLVLGTVAYMSPEQARGNSVDERTDIFSFGVLLHELLTGEAPFTRPSVAETLSAVLKESPPPLPQQVLGSAPNLQPIVRKALAKDPKTRYQRIRDLASELRVMRETVGSGAHRLGRTAWAKKLQVAVLIVVGVALAAASVVFMDGPGEAVNLGVGPAGRPAIAVMFFEDHTGSEEIRWLSKGLPNMLLTDLAQTPGLDVVSRQRIKEILEQVGEENLEAIDARLVSEVARKSGAGAVVSGSIYKLGEEIRIDVQVEDVGSGRVLSAHSVRGNDVFPMVDELSRRIRSSLNIGDTPEDRRIAEVTTKSLAAYRLYSEAVDARRNLRRVDARRLLKEAVKIDPDFAMAYFELTKTPELVGEQGSNERYLEKVMQLLDRLPERNQLLVQAEHAEEEGNTEEAIELLETLKSRYPDEEEAYVQLSGLYGHLDYGGENLAVLAEGVRAVPTSGPLRNQYGYYLLGLGRYEEALDQFEEYARIQPDEPNPYDSLGEVHLMMGEPEKALDKYAAALEKDPTFFASYGGRIWAFTMLGDYDRALEEARDLEAVVTGAGLNKGTPEFAHAFLLSRVGRFREAEKHLQRGLKLAEETQTINTETSLRLLSALLAIERDRLEPAIEIVREVEEQLPDTFLPKERGVFAHLLAGVAEARLGRMDEARARLAAQENMIESNAAFSNWWHHALAGEIALAEGRLDDAETAFRKGEPEIKMWFSNSQPAWSIFANSLPFRDGRARVKKAKGDTAGAIAIYRQLLTPSVESKWVTGLEPRFVLELARLLEEAGEGEAARKEYRRFLSLWDEADAELPEVREALEHATR